MVKLEDFPSQIYCSQWQHMWTEIWVNNGLGYIFLPDSTKPLPKLMLIYHQCGPVKITWGQIHSSIQAMFLYNKFESFTLQVTGTSPMDQCITIALQGSQEHAEFIWGNRRIYLHYLSFFTFEMEQVTEISNPQKQRPGPCLNIKTIFQGISLSTTKIRWSWESLIFMMRISTLVRQHLNIETAPLFIFRSQYPHYWWHCDTRNQSVNCLGANYFFSRMFHPQHKKG